MCEASLRPPPDLAEITPIIARYEGQRWGLIPLLQDIQETFGYIPPEAIRPVANAMDKLIEAVLEHISESLPVTAAGESKS